MRVFELLTDPSFDTNNDCTLTLQNEERGLSLCDCFIVKDVSQRHLAIRNSNDPKEIPHWAGGKCWWPIRSTGRKDDTIATIVIEERIHHCFEYGSTYQLEFYDHERNQLGYTRIGWKSTRTRQQPIDDPNVPVHFYPSAYRVEEVSPTTPQREPPSTVRLTPSVQPETPSAQPSDSPSDRSSNPTSTKPIPSAGTIVRCGDGHETIQELGVCIWCGKKI